MELHSTDLGWCQGDFMKFLEFSRGKAKIDLGRVLASSLEDLTALANALTLARSFTALLCNASVTSFKLTTDVLFKSLCCVCISSWHSLQTSTRSSRGSLNICS